MPYERRSEAGEIRELRLALVCYGGVSLAIYMHGVTKEIHKLVLASAAFERDRSVGARRASWIPNHWYLLDSSSPLGT